MTDGAKVHRKALLTVKRLHRDTGGDAQLRGAIDSFSRQREQRLNQPANGSRSAALGLGENYSTPPQLAVAEPPQQQRSNSKDMAQQTTDLGSTIDDGIGMLTGRDTSNPAAKGPSSGAAAPAASAAQPQGQPSHPATATPPSKDQQGAAFNVMDRLVNVHGWTPAAAAIAAGNAMQESSFNPAAGGDPSIPGGSHGMWQWNRDRLANLQNYAQSQGANWQDPNTQIDYFAQEANKVVPGWSSQQDLSQAKPISKAFEGYGIEGNRVGDAQNLFKAYQNRQQAAPAGPVSEADIPVDQTPDQLPPDQAKRGGIVKRAEGGVASTPTPELIAKALQIIARRRAATGGKQTTTTASTPAASTASTPATQQAYQPVMGQAALSNPGAELMNIFSGYDATGNPDIPGAPGDSQLIGADFGGGVSMGGSSPAAAAATPAPITPALAGQTIGNASAGGAGLGTVPMATPGGGVGMGGAATGGGGGAPPSSGAGTPPIPQPSYNNTLDEALGTNSPTMNQVFGFNYPVPPAPKAQPQGPVSQDQINAEYGVGDGSQIGTGVFASGGAIIMDALTRANRQRKAKGKR